MSNNLLNVIVTNYYIIKKKKQIMLNTTIDNTNNNSHLIGIYDKSLKLWYNAWGLHNFNNLNKIIKSKELLKWSIDYDVSSFIQDSERLMITNILKSIICTSKIYINERKTQLELIIGIFLYFAKFNMYSIEVIDNLVMYYAYNI